MESRMLQADGTVAIIVRFERMLDHRQVEEMAKVVERAIETTDDLRLLLDLRDTEEFAVGAFVSPKGLMASLKSIGPVKRYAVVGAPKIAEIAVETFGAILPLEARAFDPGALDQAMIWISGPLD